MKLIVILLFLMLSYLGISQERPEFHSKRIIIKFKESTVKADVNIKENRFNIPALDRLNSVNKLSKTIAINPGTRPDTYSLEFEEDIDIRRTIHTYSETQLFKFVEPDYIGYGGGEVVPNDANYDLQWGLSNDGTFELGPDAKFGADISMQKAWSITTGSSDIIVAILDTGLKLDHPEFQRRIWQDAQGNRGKDFANADSNPTDDHGHGTNVSSILLANANNSVGFAGVNWKSQIMSLKILTDNNTGFYSWWASAIYYAADHGARVLNMSVGGSSYSGVMEDAINYATHKGCVVVACMMNENNDVTFYPAAYKNTIAVGATSADDTRSNSFPWDVIKGSNYGEHIDIIAPGNYIYGLYHQSNSSQGTFWSGTSQATPHVAGVVSLLLALDDGLDLESARTILTSTADDEVGRTSEDTKGFDKYHGHGRLNAYQALISLQATGTHDEIPDMTVKFGPNPIRQGDKLTISFKEAKERVISIYDTSGRLVTMSKTSEASYSMNSENLTIGTNILRVQQKGEITSVNKFIVKK